MKISVRDLFWLMLLVAAVTVWWVEHRKGAKAIEVIRRKSWLVKTDHGGKPSQEELKRRTALDRLVKATDEELDQRLGLLLASERGYRDSDYEPCLGEMARRGLNEQLRNHYESLMSCERSPAGHRFFPENLALLTALRRAENKPDPLIIRLAIDDSEQAKRDPLVPRISATIENIDVEEESVMLFQGGDRRGDRWKLVLTDVHGRRVTDSNHASMSMGGGLGMFGPFEYGAKSTWAYLFDLRQHFAPPPTGKYSLRAFHHNDACISDAQDFSGFVVIESPPMFLEVVNHETGNAKKLRISVPPALTIIMACGVLFVISVASNRHRSSAPTGHEITSWHDLLWCGVIFAVATGMWLDHRHQARTILDVRPDAEAKWSIRLAAEDRLGNP